MRYLRPILCALLCAALALSFASAAFAENGSDASEEDTGFVPDYDTSEFDYTDGDDSPDLLTTGPSGGDAVLWSVFSSQSLSVAVSGRADAGERAAAETLVTYLEQMLGFKPDIVEITAAVFEDKFYADGSMGRFIFIEKQPGSAFEKYGSYLLSTDGGSDSLRPSADKGVNLYITAGDSRGLMNGVYAFLKEYCGCGWYSNEVVSVPAHLSGISIPSDLHESYVPYFEYVDTDWVSPNYEEFALANGLNGYRSPIPAEKGGHGRYLGGFCHTFTTSIVPEDELFDEHPEYFALYEGERQATQLCLSNPNVVNRAIEDTLKVIKDNYDPDSGDIQIVSLTQDDNNKYCQCADCTAIAERYGGQSGLMIWFVNQVAEAVKAAGYPDVVVDTFAYWYTRQPPTGIAPDDNVCVRLCTIECCFSHALNDPVCAENAHFMQDIAEWAKICDRLYIWDYTTNYSQTLGIFPDFGVLQSNAQVFYENNVAGVYEEGNYYMSGCNTEFGDLRTYLIAKVLSDPYCDYEAAKREFLHGFYGDAGEQIGEFIDLITERAGGDESKNYADSSQPRAIDDLEHLFIYSSMKNTLKDVDKAFVARCDELWQGAEDAVAEYPELLERVKRSEISWRYYKACAGLGEFKRGLSFWKWSAENKKLYDDIIASGATRYSEGTAMSELSFSKYVYPSDWRKDSPLPAVIDVIAIVVLLLLGALVGLLAVKKDKKLNLLVPASLVALTVLGVISRNLFVAWKNVGLYYILVLAISLVFGYLFFLADRARLGFKSLGVKRALIDTGIGAAGFLIPEQIGLFIVNNVLFDGKKASTSYAYIMMWLILLCLICVLAVIVKLILSKKSSEE